MSKDDEFSGRPKKTFTEENLKTKCTKKLQNLDNSKQRFDSQYGLELFRTNK